MTAIRHPDKPGECEPEQQICPTHRWRDQESWLLSLQGTRFRIVTALFYCEVSGCHQWAYDVVRKEHCLQK